MYVIVMKQCFGYNLKTANTGISYCIGKSTKNTEYEMHLILMVVGRGESNTYQVNITKFYTPASEARKEEANLTERKNLHTPVYGVKEFVCLSVCQDAMNFDPNYLRTGRTEWTDIFFISTELLVLFFCIVKFNID